MQPSATIIADSVSPAGKRLVSVGVTAHRFILAEINTHRMISKSYRSSRAVPSKKLIEEVRTDPAMPVHWGANEKGMQASGELTNDEKIVLQTYRGRDGEALVEQYAHGIGRRKFAEDTWREAAVRAADAADLMAAIGLHKQIANRVLEPFLWVHGVLTATEWENFFGLRLHKAAQPEFRALANAVWGAMKDSTPRALRPGQWHLPFIDANEGLDEWREPWFGEVIKRSVARCARSSYNSFDTGKRSTPEEDLATYAKLNIPGTEFYDPDAPIHAGPSEHQGTPDEVIRNPHAPIDDDPKDPPVSLSRNGYRIYARPAQHGNFIGWRQYRKTLPGEAVAPLPKEYGGKK